MMMAIHLKNATAYLMLEQSPSLLSGVARVRHDHTILTQFCYIDAIR
jgi:hypothetical protein